MARSLTPSIPLADPTTGPTTGPTTDRAAQPAGAPRHGTRWTTATAAAVVLAVVVAPLLQLTQQVLQRAQADGPAATVAWWAEHPTLAGVAMALGLLAVPLLVLTALVTVRLTRERSRRVATTGGCLLVVALVALAAVQGSEQAAYWMLLDGDGATAVRLLEVTDPGVPGLVMIVMMMSGAVLGTLLLAAALWRSRSRVLRGAAVAKVLWLVCDFVLAWSVPAQLFGVAGAVLLACGVWSLRSGATGD